MSIAVDDLVKFCEFSADLRRCRYCPNCGADWQAGEIPQADIDAGYYGTGKTHFSHLMGCEIPSRYDGVSEWVCQSCGQRWDRWTERPIGEFPYQPGQPTEGAIDYDEMHTSGVTN